MDPSASPRPRLAWIAGALAVLVVALAGGLRFLGDRAPPPAAPPPPRPVAAPAPPPETSRAMLRRVRSGQTPSQLLAALDLPAAEAQQALKALEGVPGWKSIYPGDQVRLERGDDGALRNLSWRQG